MDKDLLEKLELIYKSNLIINQRYHEILALLLQIDDKQINRPEILSGLNQMKLHLKNIFKSLNSIKNSFALLGKQ